jgi:hypothetical protein
MSTEYQLIQQGQQGNIEAIATLLTHNFNDEQITITTHVDHDCLIVILTTEQNIDKITTYEQIKDQIIRLKPALINRVKVEIQIFQDYREVWSDQFDIKTPISPVQTTRKPLTNPQPKPQPKVNQNVKFLSKFIREKIDREGYKSLGVGLGLALLICTSSQVTFFLSYLIILIHELGHAFFGWIFGYPSIPAFNFMHGGGVTMHQERSDSVLFLIYGGLGFLFYYFRQNKLTLICLFSFTLIYSWITFNPLHQAIMIFMGHGFELVFGGIFLYRAISGFGVKYSIERPLYAMLGFFTIFRDFNFGWNLIYNLEAIERYEDGIGGLLDNDFVILAREFFYTKLSVISGWFLVLTVLTPIMTFLLFRYSQIWIYFILKILKTDDI